MSAPARQIPGRDERGDMFERYDPRQVVRGRGVPARDTGRPSRSAVVVDFSPYYGRQYQQITIDRNPIIQAQFAPLISDGCQISEIDAAFQRYLFVESSGVINARSITGAIGVYNALKARGLSPMMALQVMQQGTHRQKLQAVVVDYVGPPQRGGGQMFVDGRQVAGSDARRL